MNIIQLFANNVKKYRNLKGISQEYLAELSGLHRTYISSIECYRRSVSLNNIQKIAKALDVDVYKLFLVEEE